MAAKSDSIYLYEKLKAALTFITQNKAISLQWSIASTSFLVILSRTSGSRSTRTFQAKRNTFFSSILRSRWKVTYLVACTILMSCAFHLNTGYLRVSLETSWTIADRLMKFYFAKSIASTNGV